MTAAPSGRWHQVDAATAPATPWRNGGGMTRELLRLPAASASATDGWDLRISLADVERDGPFSAFPGVQRWIAVVAGAGMRLEGDGAAQATDLRPGTEPLCFDGARTPRCSLLDGPIQDLNVMVRRDAKRAVLLPAAWRQPWSPAGFGEQPARGVFARQAVRLVGPTGHAAHLPAMTLVFCESTGTADWTLLPAADDTHSRLPVGPDPAPPAWWIACAPSATPDPRTP